MKSISSFALAASFAVGAACVLSPLAQASAAPKKKEKTVEATTTGPESRRLVISREAQPALKALEKAVKAKDNVAYPAALAAAQAVATTPDDKYVVSKFRLEHGLNTNDAAEQMAAIEATIASGSASPTELPNLHQSIGILAFNGGDWQKSHDAFARAVELNPNNLDAVVNLALAKMKLRKGPEALPLLERAIAATKAAGKPVPEAWYRNALQIAYETRRPQALALSREVLAAYPSPENWRNALVVYRDTIRADDGASLDVLRLMRAAKVMQQKNEYYDLAMSLNDAGLPGEAKAVLEEGVRANVARTTDSTYQRVMPLVTSRIGEDRASLPALETKAMAAANGTLALKTADAYFGYGDYAKAIALYRAALSKGSIDANVANTRLGMALAMSGDRPGAEAAFKAVTGPRADLAALWLSWLAKSPA